MLPKTNRADTKTVATIFKEGRSFNSPSLNFKFILTQNSSQARISFIVPKNIAKLAVQRNFLRRRGYDVLRKYIDHLPGSLVGVLIFKKFQDDVSIIEDEIKNILSKIN